MKSTGMKVTIRQVESKKDLRKFICFRHRLYANDPNYVPELNLSQKIFLGRKNPFFKHSEAAYFLAFYENQPVGRIAAVHNRNHLKRYNDSTGFFGFFDFIDEEEVSRELLKTASRWLKRRGLKNMLGPENFSTNDSVGILVDGFDEPPVLQMPYNRNYYEKHLLAFGMKEKMELYSYRFHQTDLPEDFMEKAIRIEQRLNQKGIKIRPINFRHFKKEMDMMRGVYNNANENHWGFVPLTSKEFMFLAGDLRQIVSKENVLFAERGGVLIGYLVTVPDLNRIFSKIPGGKLFPFGWTKLLWKPKIKGSRMLILGVLPQYRSFGIDACFYAHMSRFYQKRGIEWSEACYVMKDNFMMNRIIQNVGGKRAKTYRLYEKVPVNLEQSRAEAVL